MKRFFFLCLLLFVCGRAFAGPLVSLSVKKAPTEEVFRSLASMSGKNIVFPEALTGELSLTLHDVPYEEALRLAAASQGLFLETVGDVTIVAPAGTMERGFGALTAYPLSYVPAKEAAETLKPLIKAPLSFDQTSNTLFVLGSPGDQARAQKVLARMDRLQKQVTLEARILSLQEDASRELGLQWKWSGLPHQNSEETDGGTFHLGHGYTGSFQGILSALCQKGKAKVLATPRIVTVPGKEGKIFIGDHIPVVTEKVSNGTTTTSTEYVDAGIRLSYTPIVGPDGVITASVHTEVSTPTLISELHNYRITSRTADTNVRLLEGETLVIGGLISDEEQKRLETIPLLSKLPLLGNLFTFRSRKKTRTEVVMLLTPYLTEPGRSPAFIPYKEDPHFLPPLPFSQKKEGDENISLSYSHRPPSFQISG